MQKLCVTTVHVVAVEVQGCTLTNWGGGGGYNLEHSKVHE